jgi:hypothetical protein
MISLTDPIPYGLDEIKRVYGDPIVDGQLNVDPLWRERELKPYELPFPLRLSWDEDTLIRRVLAHRRVGDAMMDALDEIGQTHGGAYLDQNKLNHFGGIWNPRMKRGSEELSTHTWAIAIDLNPHMGRFGKEPQMPMFIVRAFKKRGFVWGGDWSYPDGMHFQAAAGY